MAVILSEAKDPLADAEKNRAAAFTVGSFGLTASG
jgi:hypothetical protein